MPDNPRRKAQGGDVSGMSKIDMTGALGRPLEVAAASFEAGYLDGIEEEIGDATPADVKRGYTSYGKSVGEKR